MSGRYGLSYCVSIFPLCLALVTGLYISCTRKSGGNNFAYLRPHILEYAEYILYMCIEREMMVVAVADFPAEYLSIKCSKSSNHHQQLCLEVVRATPTSKYRHNKVPFGIVESCDRGNVPSNSSHVLKGLLNRNRPARLSLITVSYPFRSSHLYLLKA